MAIIVPDQGEAEILERFLNTTTGNVVLRLFTNSFTPGEGTVVGDFTEVSGFGYSEKSLAEGSWSVSTDGSGVTAASFAQQTFLFTSGPVTVEGYYFTNVAGTKVIWTEKFAGPANVPSGGGTLRITPSIEAA